MLSDALSYRELRQGKDGVPKASDARPVVLEATDDADMATPNDAAVSARADLEGRLREAQMGVDRLQKIPIDSCECVQGFEQKLAEAIAVRDAVLREKRAAKPLVWRLNGAQRAVGRTERAKSKVASELEELVAQQVDWEQRLAQKRAELEAADAVHVAAMAALAAVRAEAADGGSVEAPTSRGPLTPNAAYDFLQGLGSQLHEIPQAVAAGNLEAAVCAMQQQVQAMVQALRPEAAQQSEAANSSEVEAPPVAGNTVGHRPPGTAASVSGMVAEGEALALDQPVAPIGHRPLGTEEAAASLAAEARSARPRPY